MIPKDSHSWCSLDPEMYTKTYSLAEAISFQLCKYIHGHEVTWDTVTLLTLCQLMTYRKCYRESHRKKWGV